MTPTRSKHLPPSHPTVQVFVDESGTARQSRYLAVGALSFRRGHGLVCNQLTLLRDRANWRTEAHFVNVNRSTLHLCREAVTLLAGSDATFTCLVVDTERHDPFASRREAWKSHAQLVISLVSQVVGSERIASVVIDQITPPADVNYEGYVASAVNRTADRLAIAGVCRMDSRACWGLQLADLLTGATAHQYRQATDASAKAGSPKGQLASHIANAFNLETLVSARSTRFTVIDGRRLARPTRPLKVVRQADLRLS